MGENDKVMPLDTGEIIASTKVIKRDGRIVEFNSKKIVRALTRAMEKTDLGIDTEIIDRIVNSLINSKTFKDSDAVDVDFIQNFIENDLMKSRRKDVAKEYILYRDKRNRNRDSRSKLIKNIKKKLAAKNIENQNANVDEHSFGGRIGEASRIVTKEMALDYCMSEMSRNNHLNNYIYVHDLDSLAVGCHNCLDGSMWVKISKNGNSRVITLENLAKEVGLGKNQLADVSSAGFQVLSRDGWTKLNKVSSRELRPNEELFEIKTKTGLKLILTGDHRLPVIDDTTNTEIIKTVNKLSIGDKLLDSENITLSSEDISDSFLDLTELDDSKVDLRITNLTVLKDYLRYRYKVNFSEYARSNNFQLPTSSNTIKLSDYKKLVKDYPLPLEVMCELKLKSSGSKHYYPLFIPYTPQLAKIYAYLYADGGVYINEEESLYQITFTNTNEALIDDFINCYESVFGYRLNKSYPWEKSTSPCIRVTDGTKLIAKLFKDFAGARKYGANDISIPDFVMNGDNTIKYAYLSAAIDTDGCLDPSNIGYYSCCKQYCDQMVLLLEGLGYSPHIIKSGNAGDTYRFGSKVGKRNFDSYSVKIYKTDEKYLLQNNMTALKYRDSYCFKGISSKYYKNQIISIKSYIPESGTNVFDLETESHWFIVNNYVSHNCLSIPFDDLLKNGFNTRQVDIRPANSINTAFQLVAVIFQIQSLQQFGGVSATHLDWTMVPYVRKSYYKHYKEGLEFVLDYTEEQIEQFGINDTMPIDDEKYKSEEKAFNYAMKLTIKELNQAAEGMYHNLNSLQSRSGRQNCRIKK